MIFGNHARYKAVLQQNREAIIVALRHHAIEEVTIEYNGGGDSGCISEIKFEPETEIARQQSITLQHVRTHHANGEFHTELIEETSTLENALEDFTMSWVGLHHSGWENNEGGRGTVTIDVLENTFELEHVTYYTETSHHAYSL